MFDAREIQPNKIIVRMPNWVGDVVMAIPIILDLKHFFPRASVTVMCRRPMEELLKGIKEIDNIISFKKTGRMIARKEKKKLLHAIREGSYDLGIVLPNSFSSAWWFYQGRVRKTIGFEGGLRKRFLTNPVFSSKNVENQHLIWTYKELLAPLGINMTKSMPVIFTSQEEKEKTKQLLARHGVRSQHKLVGINPGAAYGSAKCWLPEKFRNVTRQLLENKDCYVIYFGDAATENLVKEICHGISSRVINMAGLTSLRELIQLIEACDVLLTNDSGPMHIAGAVGTEVVALFGSTNPTTTGPFGAGYVVQKKVPCSPCYRRVCPIDFQCMKQIGEQEVVNAILDRLSPRQKLQVVF